MSIRRSRILLLAIIALWIPLVAAGRATNYASNWSFVQHVQAMGTIFPEAGIGYRAIHAAWLQHVAYDLIIATEVIAACLCGLGTWQMWRQRHSGAAEFGHAQRFAVAGLCVGLLLWLGGFIAIGGEWFGMWMSTPWNGLPSAFRFVVVLLAALILLGQPDGADDRRGDMP